MGSCVVKVEDKVFRLQIWDTIGQENFRSITKIFYRNTHAVILCYSIGDRQSFEHLESWLKEIRTQCPPDVAIYLTGCKKDLPEGQRAVSKEKALAYKSEFELSYFSETSAKENSNIEQLFVDISKFLYLSYK